MSAPFFSLASKVPRNMARLLASFSLGECVFALSLGHHHFGGSIHSLSGACVCLAGRKQLTRELCVCARVNSHHHQHLESESFKKCETPFFSLFLSLANDFASLTLSRADRQTDRRKGGRGKNMIRRLFGLLAP